MLYVFFVIDHAQRQILHCGVTDDPRSEWVTQQLREAFPYDNVPRYRVFDRDLAFSQPVARLLLALPRANLPEMLVLLHCLKSEDCIIGMRSRTFYDRPTIV